MNKRIHPLLRTALMLLIGAIVPTVNAALFTVTNVSTDPGIFECYLTATQYNVTISNQTVQAVVYKDDAPGAAVSCPCDGIPVPVINLKIGQKVICHFKNTLPIGKAPEGASIHWHGIELDNDSDGTGVTQDALLEGQTYTYQFEIIRPGLFWFHSHMVPGNLTFSGMYGVLLVPNTNENALIAGGTLPPTNYTYTMALSDIEFNPTNGFVGKYLASSNTWYTINDLVNICHQDPGASGTKKDACGAAGTPGKCVLLNGQNSDSTPITNNVLSGQRIRLKLMNEAISRDFRIQLLDASGNQINLYRIGGQGGLLNNPRLEGGTNKPSAGGTGWDTGYDEGEIVIGSGDRADAIALATGPTNGILRLVGKRLPNTFGTSQNLPVEYPIAYFKLLGSKPTPDSPICECETILPTPIENIKTNTALDTLTNPGSCPGTNTSVIRLTNGTTDKGKTTPAIDSIEAALEGNTGNGDFLKVPHPKSTRYAKVGDLLEFQVRNETGTVHPFHWHGFSFQPVRILDNATGNTNYTYDYSEFMDTTDVYGGETLVFRVRLEDRRQICDLSPSFPANPGPVVKACTDSASGGAIGRWVYHCHIFSHAALGMISELVVLGNTQESQWVQHPDTTLNGLDVLALANSNSKTVADDFMAANGPITGITIWGSWLNDIVDPNAAFELKIWTDVPASPGRPSRPGWQAWYKLFPAGSYGHSVLPPVNEGFYDPSQTNVIGSDTQIHQYDFAIAECDAYQPRRGYTNWLSVTAYATNGVFGWKSCFIGDRWNDDATWSPTLIGPHWTDLHYPPTNTFAGFSLDTSFELFGPGVAPAPPAPAVVPAPPLLSVTFSDGKANVSWSGGGILQVADDVTGPWSDVGGATSPYVVTTTAAPHRFYRVRLP